MVQRELRPSDAHRAVVGGAVAGETGLVGVHVGVLGGGEGVAQVLRSVLREGGVNRVPPVDVVLRPRLQPGDRQGTLQGLGLGTGAGVRLTLPGADGEGGRHGLGRLGVLGLGEALHRPAEPVRVTDAVLVGATVRGLARAGPRAREGGDDAVDSVDTAVGVVHHHIIVVHGGVVEGVVGLDTNHRLDVPVHPGRRGEAVDRVPLTAPHDHPGDSVTLNDVLLEPREVRLGLGQGGVLEVESLEVDLEVGESLLDVAREDLVVMPPAGGGVVADLLLANPSTLGQDGPLARPRPAVAPSVVPLVAGLGSDDLLVLQARVLAQSTLADVTLVQETRHRGG
eukprot:Hpha_TRINITY_DN15526_c1_g4::TRINITY_DN15526_c1_g4_i2::g.104203::m.104203